MASNPKPEQAAFDLNGESTVRKSDANRSVLTDLLQVQRRMAGVGLQEVEVLVRELSDIFRKAFVARPEARRCEMLQSSLVR